MINTDLIPRLLRIDINGQYDEVHLSSNDKGKFLFYNYDFYTKESPAKYEGVAIGRFECGTLTGGTDISLFAGGLVFNMP